MRKGFLGSLTTLLAGTSLALAEPPAASDPAPAAAPNGASQQAPAVLPHDGPPAFVDGPHSPYWPDPLGKAQCAAPGCALPAPLHEKEQHQGQFVIWGGAEYLLWWVKNQPLNVPLVTTGNPAAARPGALHNADTVVLLGGSDLDYHTFSGGRFTLGLGFGSDDDGVWGVEGSGFFLEKRPVNFDASSSSTGVPLLARPIQNALDGETSFIISNPGVPMSQQNLAGGVASGSIAVSSFSDLYGWDVDLVRGFFGNGSLRVNLLGGFRYLNLSETLNIVQTSTLLPGGTAGFAGNALPAGSTEAIFDNFGTRNEFYGGQLGARVEYGDRLFISAFGKIALGSTHEVISLAGATKASGPGGGTFPAGLLVVSSNAGSRAHDEFAAVPEIGVNVGYQICYNLRVFVGYTFLYWSDVARPGDQINRTVNPTLVPAFIRQPGQTAGPTFGTAVGPAQPSFSFQRTDFWAQGANIGLAVRW